MKKPNLNKEQIIKLINKGLTRTQIIKKLNISKYYLSNFTRDNNIKFNRENKKRIGIILDLLNQGLSYQEIGNKFGVSKARINQIAKKYGVKRWEEGKLLKQSIVDNMIKDFNNEVPLNEIYKKYTTYYSKPYINILYKKHTNNSLYFQVKDKRDAVVISNFIGGETAINITKRNDKELLDPTKLNVPHSIYNVNKKFGIKRYPMIGSRAGGGCFWDKNIVKFILNKRDNHNWTFYKITEELNKKGKRTITGKLFQSPNVAMKYYKIKNN